MKALISKNEFVETGYRVAQVEQDANIFPVAVGMFWIDCSAEVVSDQFWFDPVDETVKPIPIPELILPVVQQPTVEGAQTL